MRKLLLLTLLWLSGLSLHAQQGNTVLIQFNGPPTGSCSNIMVALDLTTGDFYDCFLGNWLKVNGGGGALPAGVLANLQFNAGGGVFGAIADGTAGKVLISNGPGVAASFQDPKVSGPDSAGAVPTAGPVVGGGFDGTNIRALKTDTGGILQVAIPAAITLNNLSQQPFLNITDFNDVTAGTPARGDVITVPSTGKWTRLAFPGTPIGQWLGTNATDVLWTNTTSKINSVLWVDGIKYTTLAACYADLPAAGGTCEVPPNYAETLAANLVLSKNNSGFHFNGPATISMGANQVTMNAGLTGVFIRATPIANYNFPTVNTSVVFSYTGNATAFSIGASTSASVFFQLENIQISLDSAGTAAVGVVLARVTNFDIRNVPVSGPSGVITQIAWKLDGTGGFTGNGTFTDCTVSGVKTAWQLTNQSSNNHFYNGQFFTGTTGSIGYDIQSGNGNMIFNTDLESVGTAINFGNSATVDDNYVWLYVAGNTADVIFGAASFKNVVYLSGGLGAGASPVVTDNSVATSGNSVWNPLTYQMLNAGTFKTNAGFAPMTAATGDLGATALPFANLWLGTAATNNFKFQPAATTGARIITIADPLSPTTVGLPLQIASGTATMTSATVTTDTCQTAVTVAATGVLSTDVIEWAYNAAPTGTTDARMTIAPYVTAGNVNFVRCNPTAASIIATAIVLNWRVRR